MTQTLKLLAPGDNIGMEMWGCGEVAVHNMETGSIIVKFDSDQGDKFSAGRYVRQVQTPEQESFASRRDNSTLVSLFGDPK